MISCDNTVMSGCWHRGPQRHHSGVRNTRSHNSSARLSEPLYLDVKQKVSISKMSEIIPCCTGKPCGKLVFKLWWMFPTNLRFFSVWRTWGFVSCLSDYLTVGVNSNCLLISPINLQCPMHNVTMVDTRLLVLIWIIAKKPRKINPKLLLTCLCWPIPIT